MATPGVDAVTLETCPQRHQHTPVPDGYLARAYDADRRMKRGQTQARCPRCGLWAIWRTRTGRRAQGSS